MRTRNLRRRHTRGSGRPFLVLVALLALVGILPFVLPLQLYIPRIEQAISTELQEPVSISHIKLSLFPTPHIRLEGVSIGPLRDTNIQYVTVYPDLLSLMDSVKRLNSVELDGIKVDDDTIEKIVSHMNSSKGLVDLQIKKIKLHHADFKLGKTDFGLIEADIRLKTEGGLDHLVVYTPDERLNIGLWPEGGKYAATLSANHWRIPLEPGVLFDTLNAKALIRRDGMSVQGMNGTLYGGSMQGNADIDWQDGWKVNGDIKAADIDLASFMPLFAPSASVSGRINVGGNFNMSATEFGKLVDNQEGTYRFNVNNGVIYNMDLARAVRASSREVRGGQTSFEELFGQLQIKGKQIYLQDTHITSGLLKAQGNLKVGASSQLSGHARVEIKGTVRMLSAPMEISGSLADPVLLPHNATLVGAVTSTAIPQSGGAPAGKFINTMFK